MDDRLDAYFPPSVYPILSRSSRLPPGAKATASARRENREACALYTNTTPPPAPRPPGNRMPIANNSGCRQVCRLPGMSVWDGGRGPSCPESVISSPGLYRPYPLSYPLLFRLDRKYGTVG